MLLRGPEIAARWVPVTSTGMTVCWCRGGYRITSAAIRMAQTTAPKPAKLSPIPRPRVFSPLPVRAGRFREACRGRGQEAVSDLWSGDRHYVSQALAVMMGRGKPHGSLLRTRKYCRRAPRGCLAKSKTVAGRRPPPVQLLIDRGALRCRVRRCVRERARRPGLAEGWVPGTPACAGAGKPRMTEVGVGVAGWSFNRSSSRVPGRSVARQGQSAEPGPPGR